MRIAILAALACTASAFTTQAPTFGVRTVAPTTTARHVILTEDETDAILNQAHECEQGECDVDSVASLIAELKDSEKMLNARLVKIMNMIAHLQHINEKEERKTTEVRQFVKDMLRVFSHDSQHPGGFSGDIGSGPTDAYKALDPKPWKP
mmetsp:Transcript_13131/g.15784  ORF Transcript_13131/g.15784 Transcript_13131/m.15784 type:complete len:150 (+) Transcript_13131:84-533(+)|eukprot:CAMPEP_0195269230 /NCGR_PEP_ID=MMETSP0706-20130129/13634_1 /TAXON_ID=33640 /ORGANISM="Asterionellopsis glacialis, Strain CCMP134" /LENGTH=149 /DNA_ID=CAMNT_0040324277 /DNA_START=77 /DNA_END=526 /DNA_ORIENTATION=-